MWTAGRVVYSSSSRSPISVSASSLSSSFSSQRPSPLAYGALPQHLKETRKQSSNSAENGLFRSEDDDAFYNVSCEGEAADAAPSILVYVTPSTTHQCVTVGSAAAFLREHSTMPPPPLASSPLSPRASSSSSGGHNRGDNGEDALSGGCWHLGYVVCTWKETNDDSKGHVHRRTTSPRLSCWCFTLEPLPAEQLELCRAVLDSAGPLAASHLACTPVHDLHHRVGASPRDRRRRQAHSQRVACLSGLLVTPLYLCTDARAVVQLEGSSESHNVFTKLSRGLCACPEEKRRIALAALVHAAPSSAAVAYALRQLHSFDQSPLPLLTDLNACEDMRRESVAFPDADTDIYLTLSRPSLSETAAATPTTHNEARAPSQRWSALLQKIQRRCSLYAQQTVIFQGDTQASLDQRRCVLAELCCRADVTSSSTRLHKKLQAALRLVNALTPRTRDDPQGGRQGGVVGVIALDVYVQTEQKQSKHADAIAGEEQYSQVDALKICGGHVRRAVAVAAADTYSSSASAIVPQHGAAAAVVPEPDVQTLPWFTLHAAAGVVDGLSKALKREEELTSAGLILADVEMCLQELEVSEALQAHLRSLTRGILLLASLTFSTRHGPASAHEAALLDAASVEACETASRLLGVPSLELVQLLTTVEIDAGGATTTTAGSSSSTSSIRRADDGVGRHALNCAGARQLQAVVVAHLGGLLVHTLLRAINHALSDGAEERGDTLDSDLADASAFSVVSLVVHNGNAEETDLIADQSDKAVPLTVRVGGGSGCNGLQEWYAAYVTHSVGSVVCARLVSHLQQEARWEGVEREVDTWIDQLSSRGGGEDDSSLSSYSSALETRGDTEVATLVEVVQLPTAASTVNRVADLIDAVVRRCGGGANEAETFLPSADAVQQMVRDALDEVVDHSAMDDTPSTRETPRVEEPEMEGVNAFEPSKLQRCSALPLSRTAVDATLAWVSPAEATGEERDDGAAAEALRRTCLKITFANGSQPPLYLSVSQLASDILSAVRFARVGETRAVRRVVAAVEVQCASLFPPELPASDAKKKNTTLSDSIKYADDVAEMKKSSRKGYPATAMAQSSLSATQALAHALTLSHISTDGIAKTLHDVPSRSSLTLVLTIPITRDQARCATASASRIPYLNPVETVSPQSTATAAAAALTDAPAAQSFDTTDDATLRYLRHSAPLWLALFHWARHCHTQRWPIDVFAREWAVPLLTAHSLVSSLSQRTPASSPMAALRCPARWARDTASSAHLRELFSTAHLAGESAQLLHGVRALQRHARYRELTHLSLATVPVCRPAVLGVSCVFLTTATAEDLTQWRRALREAAVRCMQGVGRGWRARRWLSHTASSTSGLPDVATPHHVLTPAELHERAVLEQHRVDVLQATSEARVKTLRVSAQALCGAVGNLQQRWTTTLELLEDELVGAAEEINACEAQRRAAEDAARQEARTQTQVTNEAWTEVWAEEERRRQQQQQCSAHQIRQPTRSHAHGSLAPHMTVADRQLQEEERLAAVTTRHLSKLRRAATQAAEAALLAHVVADTHRSDATWQAQHVRRQQQRLKREAELREQQQQQRQNAIEGVASLRMPGLASATPVRSSKNPTEATTELQYSDARGLVFTRPRPFSTEMTMQSRPLDGTRVFSPSEGHVFIATIDRTRHDVSTRNAEGEGEEEEEWVVQRDLMSLWSLLE